MQEVTQSPVGAAAQAVDNANAADPVQTPAAVLSDPQPQPEQTPAAVLSDPQPQPTPTPPAPPASSAPVPAVPSVTLQQLKDLHARSGIPGFASHVVDTLERWIKDIEAAL